MRPEPDHLDGEVFVDRRQFFAQRDEVIGAAHQPSEQAGQLGDEHAGRVGLRPDQRRDRGQRVEQEVRVDLAGQGFDLGREQQLLLFLQPMLDARVVPDLDRRGDGEDRGEQNHDHRPDRPRRQVEESLVLAPARAECLSQQLEGDRRQQQHDLPVDLEPAHHAPGALVEAREHER